MLTTPSSTSFYVWNSDLSDEDRALLEFLVTIGGLQRDLEGLDRHLAPGGAHRHCTAHACGDAPANAGLAGGGGQSGVHGAPVRCLQRCLWQWDRYVAA